MRNASLAAANRRYRGAAKNGYRSSKKEEQVKPIVLATWYSAAAGQHVVSLEVRGVMYGTFGSAQEARAYMSLRRARHTA